MSPAANTHRLLNAAIIAVGAIVLGAGITVALLNNVSGDSTPKMSRWSDPKTWGGRMPQEDDDVTIPRGLTVLLDQSPPRLKNIQVFGDLVFARQDLTLQAEAIDVYGSLEIGSEAQPFKQSALINLLGDRDKRDGGHTSTKGVTVLGGRLDLHGQPHDPSWTRLSQTAHAGDSQIVLDVAPDWQAGAEIVITSTEVDQYQAEQRTIKSVQGKTVMLDRPLAHDHSGEIRTINGVQIGEKAEVGLLTRSIRLQGDRAVEDDGLGGHLMITSNSLARISWTEFYHMGQKGELARYPIHFHVAGDETGSYIRDNSIHESFNRCLTIHGTHNVVAQRNVAYDTIGHCYFFEDGIETGNLLEGNLGLLTRAAQAPNVLILTDLTPATFWISNPDNTIRNNVAAGSDSRGFWYDTPVHPTGLSKSSTADLTVWPRRTPLREFSGNLTHSDGDFGLLVGSSSKDGLLDYTPRLSPVPPGAGADSAIPAVFQGLTTYKVGKSSAFLMGENLQLVDSRSDEPVR